MFENTKYVGDIRAWNVSNVTNMKYMFCKRRKFYDDDEWFYSETVESIAEEPRTDDFNQDLSGWDVGKVTNMEYMFCNANAFNQNLSSWDVGQVKSFEGFDKGCEKWLKPKPNFKSK